MKLVPSKHGGLEIILNLKHKTTYVWINTTLYLWTNAHIMPKILTLSMLHETIVAISCLVKKVPS